MAVYLVGGSSEVPSPVVTPTLCHGGLAHWGWTPVNLAVQSPIYPATEYVLHSAT